MRSADPGRAGDIRAIHAMRRQLALTDDSYRAMVSGASGGRVESSAVMSAEERGRLLDNLRRLGGGKKVNARRRPPAGADAQLALLRALWLSLYNLGEARDPRDDALAAWVCHQLEIDAFRWADAAQLRRAIEAMKGWCARVGYAPSGDAIARRVTLITLQWRRLREAGALRLPAEADAEALRAWADRNQVIAGGARRAGLDCYEPSELDRMIRDLGKWLRKARATAGGGDGA